MLGLGEDEGAVEGAAGEGGDDRRGGALQRGTASRRGEAGLEKGGSEGLAEAVVPRGGGRRIAAEEADGGPQVLAQRGAVETQHVGGLVEGQTPRGGTDGESRFGRQVVEVGDGRAHARMIHAVPSNDDLLFAEHAVKAGFLSREEVDETLAVQRRMEEMGVRDSLRNVLVNRGALREGDAAIVARQAGLKSGREPIPGYTLESKLGAGAMGAVYKAWQKGMQRHVAVKILRRDLTNDPRQVERLRREAALVGKLDHPGIVRGLDSGESEGLVWFAMEYVEGETLLQRIRRTGPIPWDEAVRITRQLAEALAHAHSQGVVHRDIKPGNVLLDKEGTPRLTDYGLAKGQSDDALTQIDATLGTPQYVSPEQARNPRDADIRSDIYSLGATLYTMLTGHPPFEGETLAQTLTKVLYERPRPLSERAPQTPPSVVYLVERMMARDRRHRYPDPAPLLADLRQAIAGRLTVPAGFEGDIGAFVERRRARRMWLAGAGIVAAAVAASLGVVAWEERETARRRGADADAALDAVTGQEGDRSTWTGATVEAAIKRLEGVIAAHPGTRAADRAERDLAPWKRQAAAIVAVQELVRRAEPEAGAEPPWAAVVEEIEALQRRLASDPDASVARTRIDEHLAAIRDRRDRRARLEIDALRDAAPPAPGRDVSPMAALRDAAATWEAKARTVAERYYGGAPSEAATEANQVAQRFQDAAARLDRFWAAWNALGLRATASDPGDLARAETILDAAAAGARADASLSAALATLPPAGRWTSAVADQEAAARGVLTACADRAWDSVRQKASRLADSLDFAGALSAIDAFAGRATTRTRADAVELRQEIETRSHEAGVAMADATSVAARRFFDAYGRRDQEQLRLILSDLTTFALSRAGQDGGAGQFAEGAKRLGEISERVFWSRVRSKLPAYTAAGGGLTDTRTRIGLTGITDVRVDGDDLRFSYAGGRETWSGPLSLIDSEDLIRVAEMRRDSPEEALVVASIRVSRYTIPADPAAGVRFLSDVGPLLDLARRVEGTAVLVDHLARIREGLLAATRRQIDDAESRAAQIHATALEHVAGKRFTEASVLLRQLLETQRLRRTDYVTRLTTEIKQSIALCERSVSTAGFAGRFPGARWTELPDGTAELFWDFEDAAATSREASATLGLKDGRVAVVSRLRPDISRPALASRSGAELPVRLDHVLAWAPSDERGSVREAAVRIASPFLLRRRIEVTFGYRAPDRPVFLGASICGAAAGVLSLQDRFGGRGVNVWGAESLADADLAFSDERYHIAWIESHPKEVQREEATRFFCFEPGRVYRIRLVRDDRRTQLWVDGRLRMEADLKPVPGPNADQILIGAFDAGEIDDLRITGTPDPDFGRKR